jgi:ElaA protein
MSTSTAPRVPAPAAMQWQWGRLSGLAVGELYAVMAARQQVFAVEQQCAFLDADGLDLHAWHLLGWDAAAAAPRLASYLRLVDPGHKFAEPSIGRVLTAAAYRGTGLGRVLMNEGLARAAGVFPGRAIRIAAQQQLEAFYASLGFRTVTAPFLEDGIPHVEMQHPGRASSAA